MAEPAPSPLMEFPEMPEFYMIVAQNNAEKCCVVEDASEAFVDLLGLQKQGVSGKDLLSLLAPESRELITDKLEYDPTGDDLFDSLHRARNLKWVDASGKNLSLPIQLERIMAGANAARFRLMVPDARDQRAKDQLQHFLKAHLEGQAVEDVETGLPNRESCLRFYDSIKNFAHSQGLSVAFATMRMDRHDKSVNRYGYEKSMELMRHMAHGAKRALAAEDVMCRLNERQIALFMFNVSRESVRVMLSRLRWLIRSHRIDFGGKPDFSVTVSFAFDMLGEDGAYDVLESCESALENLHEDERNQLFELGN